MPSLSNPYWRSRNKGGKFENRCQWVQYTERGKTCNPVSRAGKCSNEKYVPISTFCDVVKLMSRVKSGFIFPFRLLTCTANSWNSTTDFKNSLTIVNIK